MTQRLSTSSFLIVTMLLVRVSAQSGKPERREVRHTDSSGPTISTFSQLATGSDAIVIGTVGDISYIHSDLFEVDTRYQILPNEVLKSDAHSSVNLSWSVIAHGGRKEEATIVRIIEYENAPTVVLGQKYVMFLRWSQELGAYMIQHQAEGVFQVTDDGTVASSGKSVLAKTASGTTLAMVRTLISSARH